MKKSDSEIIVQSKALDILGSLDKKEFQQLGKYLDTFMVSNSHLKSLYSFLRKYYPGFNDSKLTKSRLHKAVYGEKAVFSDLNVRKLLSDIYKEAERFIAILHLRSNEYSYGKILLEEFDERKLDSLFISKYEELNRLLDNENAYPYRYIEKHIIEWFYVSFHLERSMQNRIVSNVYRRAEYIIFYFLSDLFITLQDMNVNKDKYHTGEQVNLAEMFISCLDTEKLFEFIENKFPGNSIIKIFFLSYISLKYFDDEKNYYALKKCINDNFSALHEASKRGVTAFLINYCHNKISRGSGEFELELNGHYNTYINHGLYNISGENYLRIDLFLSILKNYFKVRKISEAAGFLESSIQLIQPMHRKNMLALSSALIEFERKNYAISLKHATNIKSNTQIYKDTLRALILKNNFELKNYDIAKEICGNYRKSLEKNDRISPAVRERNINFLSYYKKLLKLSADSSQKTLAELKREIQNSKNISESQWLLEKIDEGVS